MKSINWKVRLQSKKFWIAMIPALLYLVDLVGKWFGLDLKAEVVQAEAMQFIDAVFVLLMLMGIVVDPTTKGLKDSERAMEY